MGFPEEREELEERGLRVLSIPLMGFPGLQGSRLHTVEAILSIPLMGFFLSRSQMARCLSALSIPLMGFP